MTDWNQVKRLQQQIGAEHGEHAFKELFLFCFPVLVRYSFPYIQNKEKAEEIAADVLIRLWNRRFKLDQITDLKLYLYKSTKNTALNYLKKQRLRPTTSLEDNPGQWLKTPQATPEQILISQELQRKIQLAIQGLPAKCQLIYKLIKEDELKYQEVADLLQLSVKTIEAQMRIAFKKLYEALQSEVTPSRQNTPQDY